MDTMGSFSRYHLLQDMVCELQETFIPTCADRLLKDCLLIIPAPDSWGMSPPSSRSAGSRPPPSPSCCGGTCRPRVPWSSCRPTLRKVSQIRTGPGWGPTSHHYKTIISGPGPPNPIFRSRGRSPDPGNAILRLFGPIRIDVDQVSAQAVDSRSKS